MSELGKKHLEKFLSEVDPAAFVVTVIDEKTGQVRCQTYGGRADITYCERFLSTIIDNMITSDQKKES